VERERARKKEEFELRWIIVVVHWRWTLRRRPENVETRKTSTDGALEAFFIPSSLI